MKKKLKILIADDVALNREMLASILEDKYEVYQAENGQQTIEMLEANDRIYRLVLLDIMMPVKDGFEVLKYMKERNLLQDTPVIVITGEGERESLIKAYGLGAADVFIKPFVSAIVLKRIENVMKIYRQGYIDSLTGGFSRNAFIREASDFLKNYHSDKNYAIIYFNIKNFKAVNELCGIADGDYVLKLFYDDLQASKLKPIMTSRLEADHYVTLVDCDNIDFERISKRMESVLNIKGKAIKMFARFGVYYIKDKDVSVAKMIDMARIAKQKIVDESIKPYAIYDDSMTAFYVDQAEALSNFETGIKNREFKVFYQPVVDAKTEKIVSAEALIRWIHPKKGFINPGAFIPALESSGYISKLDKYVIDEVNKLIEGRLKAKLPIVPVSVNLSWMDFYDESVNEALMKHLKRKKISKDRIRLELTETSYAALEQNRVNMLDDYKNHGAFFLLDDFGTGYSSFAMLEKYNFDILKIDMSFVRKIDTSEHAKVIIKGIIDMCHNMGIKTIAEGAETDIQIQFLREADCDYIQGFYYSKPLPEEEFIEYVQLNM